MKIFFHLLWLLLVPGLAFSEDSLPQLATPEAYSEFFLDQATASKDLTFSPIARVTSSQIPPATAEQESAVARADQFIAGLPNYSKFLGSLTSSDALMQYKGITKYKDALAKTPSWGTFITSKMLSLVIVKDVANRLRGKSIGGAEARSALDAAYKGLDQAQVVTVISAEAKGLPAAIEAVKANLPPLPEAVLLRKALNKLDGDAPSMPFNTLDSGNLAGLFKLAELEGVAYESTKILSQYAKLGGQMELTPEEFQTRFKLLLPEFVPPSVGEKVVDSATVIQVTRGLASLP